MNKKVLGFVGILMFLVVGFLISSGGVSKVLAEGETCSVLHSFVPSSIKDGDSSTQIFSFVNWDQRIIPNDTADILKIVI